jgi:hypothetical protein
MHNWEPPKNPFEEETAELTAYQWSVIRTGLLFLIFSTLLQGAGIWAISQILESSEILSGSLEWTEAMVVSAIAVVMAVWKKTFFK